MSEPIVGLLIASTIVITAVILSNIITEMMTPDLATDLELGSTIESGPVSPEFEQRVNEIYTAAIEGHPELSDFRIKLEVVPHIPYPIGTVYGYHKPGIVHKVVISQSAHDSDKKLVDTVCHELAHVLDDERRGHSGHDAHFHSCQDEIESCMNKPP